MIVDGGSNALFVAAVVSLAEATISVLEISAAIPAHGISFIVRFEGSHAISRARPAPSIWQTMYTSFNFITRPTIGAAAAAAGATIATIPSSAPGVSSSTNGTATAASSNPTVTSCCERGKSRGFVLPSFA